MTNHNTDKPELIEKSLVYTEIETLLEQMDDEDAASGWVGDELRRILNQLLPKDHPNYWKHHCAACGLWHGGEPEQEGYCQCE